VLNKHAQDRQAQPKAGLHNRFPGVTIGKAKDIAKQYENKEVNAGLKVKKIEFKTVTDLSNSVFDASDYSREKSL
jgi:hypothetical protein